jgi:outer membrane protein TolC
MSLCEPGAVNDYLTFGTRYDWYKPKFAAATFNTQWAVTPYVSIPLQNGFQIIAEYQHRDFQLNASNHRQNDTFQARIIFIK